MKKPKAWVYIVRGSGHFPTDMLRYDQSWTQGQDDVSTAFDYERATREVTLQSAKEPTRARWESFGWLVVECNGIH